MLTISHHAATGALIVLLALAPLACGEYDHGPQPARSGSHASACAHYDAIADELGCTPIAEECSLPPACEELGQQWLACVARDLRQCRCESAEAGGDLNCEGSFKRDEGPARCIEVYQSFEACQAQYEVEEE